MNCNLEELKWLKEAFARSAHPLNPLARAIPTKEYCSEFKGVKTKSTSIRSFLEKYLEAEEKIGKGRLFESGEKAITDFVDYLEEHLSQDDCPEFREVETRLSNEILSDKIGKYVMYNLENELAAIKITNCDAINNEQLGEVIFSINKLFQKIKENPEILT